jgi:septum formation protein
MILFDQLKNFDLILGSQSPRRKTLLESAGFSFRTWVIPTKEEFSPNFKPSEIAKYLATQKALAFSGHLNNPMILITADTIVVKDNRILNKAGDHQHAKEMLSMLNNTSHEVITGVCITSEKQQTCFSETTKVYFANLTPDEISWYINQYQPFDKAGAYGIQEWIGMTGVEKIEGCYYNVVGLPVPRLFQEMKSFVQNLIL